MLSIFKISYFSAHAVQIFHLTGPKYKKRSFGSMQKHVRGDKTCLFLSAVSLGVQLLELKWGMGGVCGNNNLSLRHLPSS